jgi:polyhydroxyalkanoate synthase subunit PhaC
MLKTVLLSWSVSGRQLHDLTAEIEAHGPARVERAVEAAIAHRVEGTSRPVVWHEGTTRLLDYGRDARGRIVLVTPSLINRYYVLDLLPERSFPQHLAKTLVSGHS